jgi:hypothetical protein
LIYFIQTIKHKTYIPFELEHSLFPSDPSYKLMLHKEIFELCQFGKHSWTHTEIYEFPITLRKFYYNELAKVLKQESDEIKKIKNIKK